MEYRTFGSTGLKVSSIGFGAWGIGGAAMAGDTPIGWGRTEDTVSIQALQHAFEQGINFFDTADFYGLGRSETLIGEVFANSPNVVIASKVGHRLDNHGKIFLDYSREHILRSCEKSLIRLRRDTIDFYQLHTAKVADLENGECIEAMEQLVAAGKIRHWGLSLNTFNPFPEATYMLEKKLGGGFQLVLNIINQRVTPILERAAAGGYGIIARMPLQFGLLTGKFNRSSRFHADDHRSFRLTPAILASSLDVLEKAWPLCEKYGTTKTGLALSFILSFPEVSTVIPGIKTPNQVDLNTSGLVRLSAEDKQFLRSLYQQEFTPVLELMEKAG